MLCTGTWISQKVFSLLVMLCGSQLNDVLSSSGEADTNDCIDAMRVNSFRKLVMTSCKHRKTRVCTRLKDDVKLWWDFLALKSVK